MAVKLNGALMVAPAPAGRSSGGGGCKLRSSKIVLLLVSFAVAVALINAPPLLNAATSSTSSSESVAVRWAMGDGRRTDPRYVSPAVVRWDDVAAAMSKLDGGENSTVTVGLVNFNGTEAKQWRWELPRYRTSPVRLDPVDGEVTWETLYPEWIDEEEEAGVPPACPRLPEPDVPPAAAFDVVAVKLPCSRTQGWSRDVARLHLQLAAAKLAATSSTTVADVRVIFVTECHPLPNLFSCKNLVGRHGDVWVYKPDVRQLRQKLRLPVGSCELALPLNPKERLYSVDRRRREAYATILHSAAMYVCGAIVAAQSIRRAGSTRDLVILVDDSISGDQRAALAAAGWILRSIDRIRNPHAERGKYNEYNYSKLRLWQLTEYDKVIFIDADLLVLRNLDLLFSMPEISATGNDGSMFNSGVMVIEPCGCTFDLMTSQIAVIRSYNGGDQGFLNEVFPWWHRIPRRMNFLKHTWAGDDETAKARKASLFAAADPPELHVIHYLGMKPWACFRDYDCNWNVKAMHKFAGDEAHRQWWRVHDRMPPALQRMCMLRTVQKASLEYDRREAERGRYEDGHWRRNVSDPRLGLCFEKYCDWESMLDHWGKER